MSEGLPSARKAEEFQRRWAESTAADDKEEQAIIIYEMDGLTREQAISKLAERRWLIERALSDVERETGLEPVTPRLEV